MPERFPRGLSYQEYISTLDPDRGMILELIWRSRHFEQMRRWDFSNPRIMEMRYEDIIGNKADTFGRLLEHYGFAPPVVAHGGLRWPKGRVSSTARKTRRAMCAVVRRNRWEQEFTPLLRMPFKESAGDLLVQLGYEASMEW
ncbi:MAG: hypothetical protein ACREYF_29010 [Gammaproteobacteria bacterium]